MRFFKRVMFWLYRSELSRVGFDRLYREDGSEAAYSADRILALGDQRFEFPRSWPESLRFIGAKLYHPPSPNRVEPEFLPDKRHVLVTLGTHLHWHKDSVARIVREIAERRPELVFHFSDGDMAASAMERLDNFQRLPYIDYGRFLHRYDLVVHHGGAGIMYQCLQLDKPSIVYPIDYDQFDHAARIEYSGRGIWIRKLAELEPALNSMTSGQQRPKSST
ncbi:MAG: hypothetical protein HQL47_07950 [Gammaproteobacteria bacterium]|nr:hypothetical protein [Gammaproteobacteria bacterium]